MLMIMLALQAAVTPAPAQPTAKKGMDRVVCISDAPIGSRLAGRKVCRTAAEWQRDREDVRDDTERAQHLNKLPGQ